MNFRQNLACTTSAPYRTYAPEKCSRISKVLSPFCLIPLNWQPASRSLILFIFTSLSFYHFLSCFPVASLIEPLLFLYIMSLCASVIGVCRICSFRLFPILPSR